MAAVAPPGQIDPGAARELVDATGCVVCPGFIDIQSHSVPFLTSGASVSKVTQGVTTEILGEGWTPAPRRAHRGHCRARLRGLPREMAR